MGSYTFRWEHEADEVFVTGTFDNWSKTIKLNKTDTGFEKTVSLPPATEAVLYKFVVDGEWKHDPQGKLEKDHEGNLNNVLYPEDTAPPNSMAATVSSVAPGATTTQLAGQQPLQSERAPPPGAFPETPAAESAPTTEEKPQGLSAAAAGVFSAVAAGAAAIGLTSGSKDEKEETYSVNPIPASEGAGNPVHLEPGEKVPAPSTINDNTITSAVHDDPSLRSVGEEAEQKFEVSPIPAVGGSSNPVILQPGEKVPEPSTITGNTLTSNVKLDQASYERSDAIAPQVAPITATQIESELAATTAVLGLGPQTSGIIPESSMPMGQDAPAPLEGAAISSVGVNSTTNQLAGQVPLEPRGVPEVVAESQREAHAPPEAAANPIAVLDKKEVESELKSKVPEEPATTDSKDEGRGADVLGVVAGSVAGVGAAVAGTAAYLNEKAKEATGTDPVSALPQSVQKSIEEQNQTSGSAAAVPAEVTTSQKDAHALPEASANPEAVQGKSQAEQELLSKVPESQAIGEPAPTFSAVTISMAPAASGAPQLADPIGGGIAPLTMNDKPLGSVELNAPAGAQAQTPATRINELSKEVTDSRDISPMSKPVTTEQTQPTVTTGVETSGVPQTSTSTPTATPRKNQPSSSTSHKRNSIIDRIKGTPDSQKTTDSDGKKKGFFTKLKEKLKQ